MFRFRRNTRLGRFTPNQKQVLQQAFRSLSEQQPGDAALIFSSQAQEMETSNHPRQAANLHAQAAHAFIDAQDAASAQAQAQAALRLFLQYQMLPRAQQFFTNITRRLRNKEMTATADALQGEFATQISLASAQPVPAAASHTGRLPVACPQCGGPIRSDESDWIDDHTIQCSYCGTLIQSS